MIEKSTDFCDWYKKVDKPADKYESVFKVTDIRIFNQSDIEIYMKPLKNLAHLGNLYGKSYYLLIL